MDYFNVNSMMYEKKYDNKEEDVKPTLKVTPAGRSRLVVAHTSNKCEHAISK